MDYVFHVLRFNNHYLTSNKGIWAESQCITTDGGHEAEKRQGQWNGNINVNGCRLDSASALNLGASIDRPMDAQQRILFCRTGTVDTSRDCQGRSTGRKKWDTSRAFATICWNLELIFSVIKTPLRSFDI